MFDGIIEEIQKNYFNDNIKKGTELLIKLVTDLETKGYMADDNIKKNIIAILNAMENKDYLLINDILEYEVRKIFQGEKG